MAEPTFKPTAATWLTQLEDFPTALAWSGDGTAVLVGGGEGTLTRLDARGGAIKAQVQAHAMGLLAMSVSHRAGLVATGGQEKFVRLWDVATLEPRAVLTAGRASSVDILAWSPTAPVLATACGKEVSLWEADGTLRVAFPPHEFSVGAMCWSADGKRIATAAFDALRIWDAATGELLRNFETRTSVLSLTWKPNDETLVGGTQDSTMMIWNLREEDAFQAGPFETKLREMAFHYSGSHLVTGGGSDVTVWDFSSGDMQGEKPRYLSAHQDLITALAFQRVGPLCASGGRDGAIYFWRPANLTQPLQYLHLDGDIAALAWHPRDSHVALGTAEGTIAVIAAPGRT
jgi:WD40 repeat protein